MRHLHSFNEYEKVDEGLKDWLAGALMLLGVNSAYSQDLPKVGRQNIDKKNYTLTIKKQYDDKDSIVKSRDEKRLLRQGWTQVASTIDTLWNDIVIKNPDTTVYTLSLKFDNQVLFGSGKFEISTDTKQGLDSAFQQIIDQRGIITNVDIVSSTDKTPVGPKLKATLKSMGLSQDNAGLSKARSSSISDYLVSGVTVDGEISPINDSLITTNNLVEKGNIDDSSTRYVYVNITFLSKRTEEGETTVEKKPSQKTTIYWTKEFKDEHKKTLKIKPLLTKYKLFNHGKIRNKKINTTKCPTWK
jgi:outer membrane protein OmpA-like peptidoglycan-associated protein